MLDYLLPFEFILSIILPIIILKYKKLGKVKSFLYRLFWVDKFSDERNKGKTGIKFFRFFAKFTIAVYIFVISMFLFVSLTTFDVSLIIGTLISIVIFPLMYRAVMGLQLLIHRIK